MPVGAQSSRFCDDRSAAGSSLDWTVFSVLMPANAGRVHAGSASTGTSGIFDASVLTAAGTWTSS